MKNYELTCLISPDLSEEELNITKEKIVSLVQQEGGVLGETASPQKRALAQPIKKKNSAYLIIINFQLNPEKIENLENKLKNEGNILRYLLAIKPSIKEVAPVFRKSVKAKVVKKKPVEKVELKEIEKKLEEILEDEPR
jgi:small subunit ribosomal protein S6